METEIYQFCTRRMRPFWKDKLNFLDRDDSEIVLHFPNTIEYPGLGIWISCKTPYNNTLPKGESEYPDYIVVGKIGAFFEPKSPIPALQDHLNTVVEINRWKHEFSKIPPFGREIQESPSSPKSVALMNSWLQKCLSGHTLCGLETEPPPPLPTRVLYVGPPDGSESPRLVLGKEHQGPYIALSHCWGGIVSYTTTLKTLEERMEEIPLNDLPASFKDAVYTTRALQCNYLWIDSLCIVQDDTDDWRQEAAMMGSIFKNSFVTISATAAKNSHDGFLKEYDSRFKTLKLLHSSEVDPKLDGYLFLRPWLQRCATSIDGSGSPLSKRGWILQERLLPPRTLHFGKEQMFWECRTCKEAEGHGYESISSDESIYFEIGPDWEQNKLFLFPTGAEERIDNARSRGRYKSILEKEKEAQEQLSQDSKRKQELKRVYTNWAKLVENYTTRQLTYPTDKLIAVSGLVGEIKKLLEDEYIAGTWRNNFIDGLRWAVKSTQQNQIVTKIPDKYIAPSWSWASVNNPVEFSQEDGDDTLEFSASESKSTTEEAEIIKVNIKLASSDPFGQVSSGFITISSEWCRVRIKSDPKAAVYLSPSEDLPGYTMWASTVLPGIDLRSLQFVLAFSRDRKKPLCTVAQDGTISFPPWEGGQKEESPHDNNLFTGDAMRLTLDRACSPDSFGLDHEWWTFELQHLTGDSYLILKPCGDGEVENIEEIPVDKKYGLRRRIGLAKLVELPGTATSVIPGKGHKRIVTII